MEKNMKLDKLLELMDLAHEVAQIDMEYRQDFQYVMMMEEASEFTKEVTKFWRGKGSKEGIASELLDVMAAALVTCDALDIKPDKIIEHLTYKYNRAIERNNKNGEI